MMHVMPDTVSLKKHLPFILNQYYCPCANQPLPAKNTDGKQPYCTTVSRIQRKIHSWQYNNNNNNNNNHILPCCCGPICCFTAQSPWWVLLFALLFLDPSCHARFGSYCSLCATMACVQSPHLFWINNVGLSRRVADGI